MSKLIMLKGLPGSGKSTWAKEQVEKGEGQVKRVNKDEIRAMLDNGKWSKDNEKIVLEVRDLAIQRALYYQLDVIVDDTNFNLKHESDFRRFANIHGAEFEIKFFDIPVEECIARDARREKPVGAKVIQDMYERYLKPKQVPVVLEKTVYNHQEGLPWCVLVDIDGTLAHMKNRSPYDWHRVGEDEIDNPVRQIINETAHHVFVFSGRDGICKNETNKWLQDNTILFNELIMRKPGDKRDDTVVKREMFEQHIRGKYNVLFVLDDRDKVVKMWRELGLKCLQCAPGNF